MGEGHGFLVVVLLELDNIGSILLDLFDDAGVVLAVFRVDRLALEAGLELFRRWQFHQPDVNAVHAEHVLVADELDFCSLLLEIHRQNLRVVPFLVFFVVNLGQAVDVRVLQDLNRVYVLLACVEQLLVRLLNGLLELLTELNQIFLVALALILHQNF